jgi:hypothetical protein
MIVQLTDIIWNVKTFRVIMYVHTGTNKLQ